MDWRWNAVGGPGHDEACPSKGGGFPGVQV